MPRSGRTWHYDSAETAAWQPVLALTAETWPNEHTSQPVMGSLAACDRCPLE